jgi:S1-C subfamily serine protease
VETPGGPTTTPTAPAPPELPTLRSAGIDTEPVVEAGKARGIRVTRVYPGSPAETAGLRPGDVIQSTNDYVTEHLDHLRWIIANAARDGVLRMVVRNASDGKERTAVVRLP